MSLRFLTIPLCYECTKLKFEIFSILQRKKKQQDNISLNGLQQYLVTNIKCIFFTKITLLFHTV